MTVADGKFGRRGGGAMTWQGMVGDGGRRARHGSTREAVRLDGLSGPV